MLQADALARMQSFMQWMTQLCCDSLFPGAAHARCHFAIHCLQVVLLAYQDDNWVHNPMHTSYSSTNGEAQSARVQKKFRNDPAMLQLLPNGDADSTLLHFDPLASCIRSSEAFVQVVLSCVANSWMPVRKAVVRVLRLLPVPLLGLQQPAPVLATLKWAVNLLHSPRPFEADAGAHVLSLLHDCYVFQLGWNISIYPEPSVEAPAVNYQCMEEQQEKAGAVGLMASLKFILSLESGVRAAVQLAESDMVAACRHSFVQGKLLALQHTLTAFPWVEARKHGPEVADSCRLLISSLVESLLRAANCCVPYLDGRYNVDADEVVRDEEALLSAASNEAETACEDSTQCGEKENGDEELGPDVTVLVTGSWNAIKEISSTLAVIVGTILSADSAGRQEQKGQDSRLLQSTQISSIGEFFVSSLCVVKHNGATRKLQLAFEQVCCRLLQQHSKELNMLPHAWLLRIIEISQKPGQGRTDIVRRSSGFPLAIAAICVAEGSASQRLLSVTLQKLLQSARTAEEPWPRVHAFNCLRVIFETAALIKGAAASLADGVRASIEGIAEQEWEVRNAATLAYVSLVARLLGLKNTASESNSSRPSMSMQAFLCSYPSLANFLLERLTDAATQTAASQATTPHPHLHPILLLFSSMQRSDGKAREGSIASLGPAMSQFETVIQLCLSMPSLAVRMLAARALAALCPAGGLATAVAQQLESVSEHPARLRQQKADAVHGALLAARHMLLSAVPPCSTEECSSTIATAALLLNQRLWMLNQRLCRCAAVSREFVHVLESFSTSHASAVQYSSNQTLPNIGDEISIHDNDPEGVFTSGGVQTRAAQALMDCQLQVDEQTPMQDLWSQSMARLSFSDNKSDNQIVSLTTAVHALHSQEYCLRTEGFRWLASEKNTMLLDRQVQRQLADELWAAIDAERNQVALAAALEAAVCFGGGLDMKVSQRSKQGESTELNDDKHSGKQGTLQRWLAACAVGEKRLLRINSASQYAKDHIISQQVLRFTGVLLGDMIDACSHCGVNVPDAFAVESACSQLLNKLIHQVELNAGPSQPPGNRKAAVFALIRSHLLRLCTNLQGPTEQGSEPASLMQLSLRGWTVAMALLEDEDDAVRRIMAQGMGRLLETLSNDTDSAICEQLFPCVHGTLHMSSSTCNEAVLRHSFELLTQCCGWSDTYMQWLVDWVAGEHPVQELQPPVRAARRLFAREPQNSHADGYLLSQVAAQCLSRCTGPQFHHIRHGALDRSFALLHCSVECAELVKEDAACFFAWCDEYTLVCTLRGCLLAQMAFEHHAQEQHGVAQQGRAKQRSLDECISMEHRDGLGDSETLQLVTGILHNLQALVSESRQHIMHPLCRRSVEHVLSLLNHVKNVPNAEQ